MFFGLCQDKGGRDFPVHMNVYPHDTLGIDIGSTTVKIAVIQDGQIVFSDYERHYANIQETLALLLSRARNQLGEISVRPGITIVKEAILILLRSDKAMDNHKTV